MKSFLLYRDRDFDFDAELPAHSTELMEDLGLPALLASMARGDTFLLEVATKAVLTGARDPDTITYRQDILKDCLRHPDIVRQIYALTVDVLEARRRTLWGTLGRNPSTNLSSSVELLQLFIPVLEKLRAIADESGDTFRSEGFDRFFHAIRDELDDEYLQTVNDHLQRLRFRDGVLISAQLGPGNTGREYVLLKQELRRHRWMKWIRGDPRPSVTWRLPERDEAGGKALAELKVRGINLVANALAQSTDHIQSFIVRLREETGFYVGCVNAHEDLARIGAPTCFPTPEAPGRPEMSAHGLCDVGWSLTTRQNVIGNDLRADGRALVMITGANQGGKSTFVRSIGLAHLMMQCGMFVSAESFRASVRRGVFTHYRREEDSTMESGKFDEELARMNLIADSLHPNSMVLFNESFAATNEREGSEIARQIIRALLEAGVRVFFVTHQFDLADGFYRQKTGNALFLRAERQSDGNRTFTLTEGEPLSTSFGRDIYEQIFESNEDAAPASLHGLSADVPV